MLPLTYVLFICSFSLNLFYVFWFPQDDKNIAHLTHVSEMEKKCESLARITAILKDVIQNKVCILKKT